MGDTASGDQGWDYGDGAGGGAGVAVVDWCLVLSVQRHLQRMG